MLRNGDFLLLPALIWAASLSALGWARFGHPQGAGTRGKGTPPPQPGHAEHGHVSGILLPSIPQNLEPK